ncbi:MAG: plastocyanin/azurin family copper-binding protein [Haloplanus sp.]
MASSEPSRFVTRRKFAATLTGVVLAGCSGGSGGDSGGDGGGGGDGGSTQSPTSTPTATPTPTATSTATPTATPSEPADTHIEVGPGGKLRFDPDAVRVSKGDVVQWKAMSGGHNVCCNPKYNSQCQLPDGAEPFTSFKDGHVATTLTADETFRHKFTTAGEYVYVCIPHASSGMVGRIVVR